MTVIIDPVTGEVVGTPDDARLAETLALAVLELQEEQAALRRGYEEAEARIAGDRARLLADLAAVVPTACQARIPTHGGVVVAGWVAGPKPRASVRRERLDEAADRGLLPPALAPRDVPQPPRRQYPTVAELRRWASELDRAGVRVEDLISDPPAEPLLTVETRATGETAS